MNSVSAILIALCQWTLWGIHSLAGSIAQAGTTFVIVSEYLQDQLRVHPERHQLEKPTRPRIMPRLFFTRDDGGPSGKAITLLTPLELMEPDFVHLQDAGAAVLRAYDEVLMMLEGECDDCDGDIRLQNGLAAAVAGFSAEEFTLLSEDEKKSHRFRFVQTPIHRQLAPDIIIYIGTPPLHQDKPATSGRIQFEDEAQNSEYNPWDDIWEDRKPPPTAWGWVARSLHPQARFIFVAGVFITWCTHWLQQSSNESELASSSMGKLLTHLKVTLYHELAHYLRNLAYGVIDNDTPEKCIDHPKVQRQHGDTSRAVREAGRQAEAMAFGEVINLAFNERGTPELVVSDLDEPGAIYSVPADMTKLLFDRCQPSAPIKLAALKDSDSDSENLNMLDSESGFKVVGKETLAHLPIPHSIQKADSKSKSHRVTVITNNFQETLEEFQARFDSLKGPCVVHESY